MPPPSRLNYLLTRYKNGEITAAERRELMKMISNLACETPVKDFIAREMAQAYPGTAHPLSEKRAAEIFARILQAGSETPVVPLARRRHNGIRRVAAAAAVLLLVATGIYIRNRFTAKEHTATTAGTFQHDIAPGGNKAVLTLANGATIILDSARNGQLARQGNSSVVKTGSGQIAYKAESINLPAGEARHKANSRIAFNTLSTPRGGQYQLILPDGSKVWLNAASSIRFPTAFTGEARKVAITGEAYFEISGNAGKPFIVQKGNVEVQVLGTRFNVNAYDNEPQIKVTLLRGKVKVLQTASRRSRLLAPGQQLQVDKTGKFTLVEQADPSRAIAWKEGRFEFHGNIQGIMRQIARWYNVDVEYRGNVKQRAYGGAVSRYENVSKVLKMLELTGTVHFEIEREAGAGSAGKIIVKP